MILKYPVRIMEVCLRVRFDAARGLLSDESTSEFAKSDPLTAKQWLEDFKEVLRIATQLKREFN